MTDILVKPAQLRQTARNLNDSARKIRAALENVDKEMGELGPARFEGQRASELRARHQRLHGGLLQAHERILRMARRLDELAGSFEDVDRRAAQGGGGSLLDRILENIRRWVPALKIGVPSWRLPFLPWPIGSWMLPDKGPDVVLPPDWVSPEETAPLPQSGGTGGGGVQEVAHDPFPFNAENVERSRQAIDALDVENAYRYQRNRQGQNETYCNIFAMDYAHKMGAPLPEFLDWNKDGKVDRWLDANRMVDWLRGTFEEGGGAVQQGPALGWKTVDAASAAAMSSKGYVVLAGWENTGGIGHMAVVRPESTVGEIRIAQAGWHNFENGTIQDGFGTGKAVEYFVYLPQGVGTPGQG